MVAAPSPLMAAAGFTPFWSSTASYRLTSLLIAS
jgi:hypothetical protein